LRGQQFFLNTTVDGGVLKCADCHTPPPGTDGLLVSHTALQESQDMKVPQLRNLYKKTGFRDTTGVLNKRGFGFTHDGAVDNLFDFLKFPGFNFGSPQSVADANRRDVEAFLLAFDTGVAPAVGYQVTFNGANNADLTLNARLDTLLAQAELGDCELIAKGRVGSTPRGWQYQSGGSWKADMENDPSLTRGALLALASAGHELTLTGVPPGTGLRMGIDRDRDGYLDGDEVAAGSDPGDPRSTPALAVTPGRGVREGLDPVRPNPFRSGTEVAFTLPAATQVSLGIYDLMGREVRAMARGERLAPGAHRMTWDGRRNDGGEAPAGVYFVRLRTATGHWSRPVLRVL